MPARGWVGVVTALATLTAGSPALGGHSAGGPDVITLGLLASSATATSSDAASARTAVEIAVDEVNGTGGIRGWKIRLTAYEDEGDAAKAAGIAHKLVAGDQVVGVVSATSPATTRLVAPVLGRAGIPMIVTLATDREVTQTAPCTFRNRHLGGVEGSAGAEIAVTLRRARRIAVLTRDDDLGRTTSTAFVKRATMLGASIHSEQIYRPPEVDFTAALSRLLGQGVDLVYHVSAAADGASITRTARALGLDAMLQGTARLDSPGFLAAAGPTAEGTTLTTNVDRDDPRSEIQHFLSTYRERAGTEADMAAAGAYEAARLLIRGAALGGPSGRAVCDGLRQLKQQWSVGGVIHGFVNGEVIKPVQAQVVRHGRLRRFATIDALTILTPPTR
jgi:branched-chain amino acid transport system substrate-binding protein